MNIVNHTQSTVFWSVTSPGQADCGTLAPKQKFYLPVPDGPTYNVTFSAQDPTYFQINAQAGQTVTIDVNVKNTASTEAESEAAPAAAAGAGS